MKILCVDTSLKQCHVALSDGKSQWYESVTHVTRGQDGLVPDLVASLLRQANLSLSDLDRVAVGVGPGSFTGIRIGLAYVKGIMVALPQCQGIALTSFDLLRVAAQCGQQSEGEASYAVPIKADHFAVLCPDGAIQQKTTEELSVSGTVFVPDLPEMATTPFEKVTVTPQVLLIAAQQNVDQDQPCLTASDLQPIYVRDADVTVKKKT